MAEDSRVNAIKKLWIITHIHTVVRKPFYLFFYVGFFSKMKIEKKKLSER